MTMKFSYSDSEDESDSKDEYDSDFYFSDIPDDHGYSDDAVFNYNDVVITPTAPPFYPSPGLRELRARDKAGSKGSWSRHLTGWNGQAAQHWESAEEEAEPALKGVRIIS
jgi:hypothetical protein